MNAPEDPSRTDDDAAPPAADLAPSGRTETISDGVFAIAITLLVLDLHVPGAAERKDAGGALPALLAEWPAYLSYLATFLTVALVWMNTMPSSPASRYVDQPLQWINIGILLGICLTPFPNALVADALRTGLASEAARVAGGAYGLVFMATTIAWISSGSASPGDRICFVLLHRAWARRERLRGAFGATIYAAGIGIAWLSPLVAMGLFLFLALFYAVTARGFAPDLGG